MVGDVLVWGPIPLFMLKNDIEWQVLNGSEQKHDSCLQIFVVDTFFP